MFRRGGGARWREILQLLDETLKQRRSPPRSDLVALLDVVIGRVHVHLEAVRNHEVARVLMPLAVRRTECLVQDILLLQPAGLLPLLMERLSTLRSARSDLSSRLESATGRSGAYPGRTFTCKNSASYRTHHPGMVSKPEKTANFGSPSP